MASRQYIRAWKESATGQGATYGADPYVPPGSPVLNTDFIIPQLTGDSSFTVRKTPNQVEMRSWNALNRRIKTVSGTYGVSGQLVTPLYPSQATFLAYALTLNGTTNNLPSFAIDHALELNDDTATFQYNRYLGCKVQSATIEVSAESQIAMLTLNWVGQRTQTTALTVGTFPEPAWNQYPSTKPYVFGDVNTPGWLKYANTNRAEYNSLTINIENILDASMNEKPYVTRIKHCGRNVSLNNSFVHVSNADRAAFEAATEQTTNSVKFDNGTNSLLFTLGTCVTTAVSDDLSMAAISRQGLTIVSQYDGTTDLTITAA